MFTTQTPKEILVGAIEDRLDAIAETLWEAGVLNHCENSKWQSFEFSTFRNQVMGYVMSGAPFHHLEMTYHDSNTRLMIVINFDVFNRATFTDVRAEKEVYSAESPVDFTYLNRNLAKAAGIV